MSPEELDAIEKACEAATEGPWDASYLDDWADSTVIEGPQFASSNTIPDPEVSPEEFAAIQKQIHADANFIANARSWVPTLVQRVRELEAEVCGLKEALDNA